LLKNNIIKGAKNHHHENFLIDFSCSSESVSPFLRKLGFLLNFSYFPAIPIKKHPTMKRINEAMVIIQRIQLVDVFSLTCFLN
jgi:hypothetical protein